MRSIVAAVLLLAGLFAAAPAGARVFAGVGWGGSGDPADPRTLDVHAPEAPGPHPVVVLAGVAEADLVARTIAERGHVVAVLAKGRGGTVAELAQALAFVYWRGPGYGGDSERLHVVAGGDVAGALLALAADPAPLAGAGVPDGTLHAIAVTRVPGGATPDAAAPPPPLLVVAAADEAADARAGARLAEHWRALGAGAEAVVAAPARAPAEAVTDVLLRWLSVAALLRSSRFESLRFAKQPEVLPAGTRAAAVATAGGALLLATEGDGIAVWRRERPAVAWRREWAGAGGRVLWFGAVPDTGEPALVLDRDGESWLHRRRPGGEWDDGLRLGRLAAPAVAAWVVVAPEPRGAGQTVLVAVDAGADSRVVRLSPGGAPRVESVAAGERITGLAVHEGTPMAATHGPRGGRLLRRVGDLNGAWITAAAWDGARGALQGLASLAPEEPGLVGILDRGEAVRIDPARGEVQVEADLAGALTRQWGELDGGIAPTPVAAALRQPHSGDRVHLFALGVGDPRDPSRRGWYAVRQAGGHYAYGRAAGPRDVAAGALRQLVASPFVADAGGAFFALDTAEPPALRRAVLAPPLVAAGAWADRARPGRGLVLERTRGGWIALLYQTESDGGARWYSAGGRLRDGVFADSTGLVRHRRERDGRLAADPVGALSIRFGASADDPACAGVPRSGAVGLAVLEVRTGDGVAVDCIEPLRPRDAARPVVDGSGLWMAPDGGWGLAVQSTGPGPEGDERVLLFHFDAEGLPRWVLGTGSRRAGQAVVLLPRDGLEGRVSYGFRGACGDVAGSASLLLPAVAGGPALVAPETALLRAAGGVCY